MTNTLNQEQLSLEKSRKIYEARLLEGGAEYVINETTGHMDLILAEGQNYRAESEMREYLESIFREKVMKISKEAGREHQERAGKISFDEIVSQRAWAHEILKNIETNPIDFSEIELDAAKVQETVSFDEEKGLYTVGYIQLWKGNEEFTKHSQRLQEILGKNFPDERNIESIGYWLDPASKEVKAVMITIGDKKGGDNDFSRAGTLVLKADGKKMFLPDIVLKQYLAVTPSGRVIITFSTETFMHNGLIVKDIPIVYGYCNQDRDQWIGGRGVFDEDFYVATDAVSSSLWKKIFLKDKPDDWNWSPSNGCASKEDGEFTLGHDRVGGMPLASCYYDAENKAVIYPMPDFLRGRRREGKTFNGIYDASQVLKMKSE